MRLAVWFERDTWRLSRPVWVVIVTTFTAVTFMLSTAWSTPGALALFVLAPAVLLVLWKQQIKSYPLTPVIVVAGVCWLLIALSMLWSPYIAWTFKAAAIAGALIAALHFSWITQNSMPTEWLEHMTRTVLVAFIVLLVYGLIEETFDHPIKRVLFWPFRAYKFEDGWLTFSWDHSAHIRPTRTNWNVTNISFMLWPVLLMARTQLESWDLKWFVPVTFAAVFAMVFQSSHETTKVAIIVGFVVYLLGAYFLKQSIYVIAVAWLVAIVAVVPFSHLVVQQNLHFSKELPPSLRQRFVMWNYIADKLPERPILGVAAGATKPLDNAQKGKYETLGNTKLQLRTGPHPHNIYLQAYYELGVVGALLLLFFGWTILWSIYRLPKEVGSYHLAAFATIATTSATGFGLFEPWYACAQVMSAIALHLGATYYHRLQNMAGSLSATS